MRFQNLSRAIFLVCDTIHGTAIGADHCVTSVPNQSRHRSHDPIPDFRSHNIPQPDTSSSSVTRTRSWDRIVGQSAVEERSRLQAIARARCTSSPPSDRRSRKCLSPDACRRRCCRDHHRQHDWRTSLRRMLHLDQRHQTCGGGQSFNDRSSNGRRD